MVQYLPLVWPGLTYKHEQNEKNSHSSHSRSKTKASGKLVRIADYMDSSLEANDKHTIHM